MKPLLAKLAAKLRVSELCEAHSASLGRAVQRDNIDQGGADPPVAGAARVLVAAATLLLASLIMAYDFPGPESAEYAAYADSVVDDGDLNIANQHPGPGTMLVSSTYNKPDFHSHGGVVVWAPALTLQRIIRFLTGLPGPESPVTLGRRFTLGLTTTACALVILLLTFRLALRFSSRRNAFYATAAVVLGSPFIYYCLAEPGQANLVATLFATLLVYHVWTADPRRTATWIVSGLLAGMCVIVKIDLWFLLMFAATMSVLFVVTHRLPPGRVVLGALAFAFMIGAKLANDILRLGAFQAVELQVINVRGFFLLDQLFSPMRGYFYYSPVLLIALVVGARALLRRRSGEDTVDPTTRGLATNFSSGTVALPFVLLCLLGVLALKLLATAFRFNWNGGTFGARLLLTDTTPIVLLFAYGLERLSPRTRRLLAGPVLVAVLWNWVKILEYMRREEAPTFPTLWGGLLSFGKLTTLATQWASAIGAFPAIDRLLLAIPLVFVGAAVALAGGRLIQARDRLPIATGLACACYLVITFLNVINNPRRARDIAQLAAAHPERIAVIPAGEYSLDENLGSLAEARRYLARAQDRRACEIEGIRRTMWEKASAVFRAHRSGHGTAVDLGELCGQAAIFKPVVSHSSADLFQRAFERRKGSEPLGVMGVGGLDPPGVSRVFEPLAGPPQLYEFLARRERVLAIAATDDHCALRQAAARRGFGHHVLDVDSGRGLILLTNRLVGDDRDVNPLHGAIRAQEPAGIQNRLSARFEDKIELIGYDMPTWGDPQGAVPITLYFKVLQILPLDFRIFVHLDRAKIELSVSREPLGGACGATGWRPGDYIVDTVGVPPSGLDGEYSVWVGLYRASSAGWRNLKVVSSHRDSDDRVLLGSLRIGAAADDNADRDLYQSYFRYRVGAEPLGVLEGMGIGPGRYDDKRFERLTDRGRLFELLSRPEPVFAIAPVRELCAVRQAASASGFTYRVVDRSSRWLLLANANQPSADARDVNPLLRAIQRQEPAEIQHRLSATFTGGIELIGYDMPVSVARGDTFPMAVYFKVTDTPAPDHQIFVHFDTTATQFQADHGPIGGTCDTTWWRPGDYLIDVFEVKAGDLAAARGGYSVWVGFYTGSAGKWKNLEVVRGPHDRGNRVRLGELRVD